MGQIYFTENRYHFRYKSALETGTFSDLRPNMRSPVTGYVVLVTIFNSKLPGWDGPKWHTAVVSIFSNFYMLKIVYG